MIHIQVQYCSAALRFPWYRTETGLVILISVPSAYDPEFEKGDQNQKVFLLYEVDELRDGKTQRLGLG